MLTKADIERYFTEEKKESFLFILIGIAGIITGLLFLFMKQDRFFTGASIPLFSIGLLLGIVGWNVYRRSDDDRIRNVYAFDMAPSELHNKELPRMRGVMKNFIIYRYTGIFLVIAGIVLIICCNKTSMRFWNGLGFSLAFMALLALIADFFAEKRGRVYTRLLESFNTKMK